MKSIQETFFWPNAQNARDNSLPFSSAEQHIKPRCIFPFPYPWPNANRTVTQGIQRGNKEMKRNSKDLCLPFSVKGISLSSLNGQMTPTIFPAEFQYTQAILVSTHCEILILPHTQIYLFQLQRSCNLKNALLTLLYFHGCCQRGEGIFYICQRK